MSLWQEFLSEPIIFLSFTGLAILIAMGFFYAGYFVYKVRKADEQG